MPYNPNNYGADVDIENEVMKALRELSPRSPHDAPFAVQPGAKEFVKMMISDAAWELCRRGVLRPGTLADGSSSAAGEKFALTAMGREWIIRSSAGVLVPIDQSQYVRIIAPFGARFGNAFELRSIEAHGCYRAGLHYACCAMVGAAAEAILLAVGTEVLQSLEASRALYRSAGGRKKLRDKIATGRKATVTSPFVSALDLVDYWRDEAAHGFSTQLSAVESDTAMIRLLRFARFVEDNWTDLTMVPPSGNSD